MPIGLFAFLYRILVIMPTGPVYNLTIIRKEETIFFHD